MTPENTADHLAIRDLTARFTDAVNRRAPKELAELFTEDGHWQVPGTSGATGREAVSSMLKSLLDNFPHLIQLTHSGHIDVDGDTASATWYVSESGADAAGNGFTFTGVYTDALVRTGDGWRFAQRSFAFLQRSKSDVKTRWYPHPHSAAD